MARFKQMKEAMNVLADDLNLDIDLDKRRYLLTDDGHLDVETYNYITARFMEVTIGTGLTAESHRRADMAHHPVIVDLRYRVP